MQGSMANGGGLSTQSVAGVGQGNSTAQNVKTAQNVQRAAQGVNMMTQPGQQQPAPMGAPAGGGGAPVAPTNPQVQMVSAPSGRQVTGARPSLAQLLYGG